MSQTNKNGVEMLSFSARTINNFPLILNAILKVEQK